MNLPAPFKARGQHIAIKLSGAAVLFTTRRGGFSTGPYASLNLGRLTGDSTDAVDRNRAALRGEVGIRLTHIRQVHGSNVLRITSPPTAAGQPPTADGQATALRGLAPIVLTADCLPIAVAGPRAVAILHAGWRGLSAGVVGEGVAAVRELGGDGPLEAAIGPGAGGCCYDVDADVLATFGRNGEGAHRATLDLKEIARTELERSGVETVHDVALCTICSDPSLLFSHRRDRGTTGRQAGVAWLS